MGLSAGQKSRIERLVTESQSIVEELSDLFLEFAAMEDGTREDYMLYARNDVQTAQTSLRAALSLEAGK